MKTIRICMCAFVAALICILSSCRCESVGETETPACNESTRSNTEAVPQNDQLNEPRYITYAEAHDKFDPVMAEGEYEYSQAIISATEEIKQRTDEVYKEIIEILESSLYPRGINPEITIEEYREKIVNPFIRYYETRKATVEQSQEAFDGIGSALSYPTAAGGRTALLWGYVNANNFLVECLELRNAISIQ
ncbi:MAG: hypothetical protein J6V48_10255 [Clostridia bacterium]|nr:hypothetical protein [Clostridia bacterium]